MLETKLVLLDGLLDYKRVYISLGNILEFYIRLAVSLRTRFFILFTLTISLCDNKSRHVVTKTQRVGLVLSSWQVLN